MKTLRNVLIFIRLPKNQIQRNIGIKFILIKILELWILVYAFTLLGSILMNIIDQLTIHFSNDVSILKTRDKNMAQFNDKHKYYSMIAAVIIAPLIEEIVFRLWLDINKKYYIISFPIASLFFCKALSIHKMNIEIACIIFFISLIFILLLDYFSSTFIKIVDNANTNITKHLFYSSSILFALIHITNFKPVHWDLIYLYPFFVLPQLFTGLILGYTRLTYGFIWAVILHSLINLPYISFVLIRR